MNKPLLAAFALCAATLVPGLATAQETTTAPAPTTAAAPAPANVAAETGTVIFFRPSRFVGGAFGFKVREKETELGKLRSGKYFILKVAPGTHEYVVHSETKDALVLEVEAGQTYYVEGKMGMGVVAGRPNLSPSDQAAFEAAKPKMKEVEPLSDAD